MHLTAKEFAILQYLVRNRDMVVSREQILSGVWDDGGEITSNVVDVYVRL
ncbi:MAG: winged helix-turn-helix domain-containing protein, partial [Lachnospiraceae bacterium]|nr:winged helix-turn-helix domain-containing protein [Lachnospiraceae bacterium]